MDDENMVWCMLGDFNAVRKLEERITLSQIGSGIKEIR